MAPNSLTLPVSLTIDAPMYEHLYEHLFPGDGDEHGAIILAGIAQTSRGTRLLARVTRKSAASLGLAPGRPVFAQVKGAALLDPPVLEAG